MCNEMPAILVKMVVDQKEESEKREGQGGGEAQGVADPPKIHYFTTLYPGGI
jgi:hypothetical protein